MVGTHRSTLKVLASRFRYWPRDSDGVSSLMLQLANGKWPFPTTCSDPSIQSPILHLLGNRCMLSVGVEREIPVEKIKKPMLT